MHTEFAEYYGSEYQPNYGKRADMKKQPRLAKPILAMLAVFSLALGVGACGSGSAPTQTGGTLRQAKTEHPERKYTTPSERSRMIPIW